MTFDHHDCNATKNPGPLSAQTATPRQKAVGMASILGSSMSSQVGAAAGAGAFPIIGPLGVVAIRQMITALILIPTVRPKMRGLKKSQWLPVIALALIFGLMNLSLYMAIDRIGLGLSVTLEFLGPLSVAVASSRRIIDLCCAGLAAVGVLILTNPGPSSDILGISLALFAACAWAAYILLNRTLGQRLPGLQGTALASLVSAVIWLPIAITWFIGHPPTPTALLLAAACGILASIVPYVADLQSLRRISAHIFGIFTSLNPVWAAIAGLLFLGQALHFNEWLGIGLIVASNALVSICGFVPVTRLRTLRKGARA